MKEKGNMLCDCIAIYANVSSRPLLPFQQVLLRCQSGIQIAQFLDRNYLTSINFLPKDKILEVQIESMSR